MIKLMPLLSSERWNSEHSASDKSSPTRKTDSFCLPLGARSLLLFIDLKFLCWLFRLRAPRGTFVKKFNARFMGLWARIKYLKTVSLAAEQSQR
jgi:hypothetical protein